MKKYCVTYLSPGGMYYRFRCSARNKQDARKQCRTCMGISDRMIVEVEQEK